MSIDPSLQFEESQEDYGEPDMRHILGFLNQSEWIGNLNIGNIM